MYSTGNLLQLPVRDLVWRPEIAFFDFLPGQVEAGSKIPRCTHLFSSVSRMRSKIRSEGRTYHDRRDNDQNHKHKTESEEYLAAILCPLLGLLLVRFRRQAKDLATGVFSGLRREKRLDKLLDLGTVSLPTGTDGSRYHLPFHRRC